MQVKLSSQNREIISYGTVFLFDENSDLTLNINGDNYFEWMLTISFVEDISQKQRIETNIFENHLKIIIFIIGVPRECCLWTGNMQKKF